MKELKTLAFSVIATVMAMAAPAAGEPGKNGFYMNFSVVGPSIGGPSIGGPSIGGLGFNHGKTGAMPTADYAAAFAWALRFGYEHGDFRTDLELGMRSLEAENVSGAASGEGSIDIYTAMINGALDFDAIGALTPYIAFGVGGALGDGEISRPGGDGDADRTGPAGIAPSGRIGLGARLALGDGAEMTLGYSLLIAPPVSGDLGNLAPAHSLTLGFDFRF